jgi:hypothetical protein
MYAVRLRYEKNFMKYKFVNGQEVRVWCDVIKTGPEKL